jgi:GTP pyrophosphokinase
MPKEVYLRNILEHGSVRAKILKCADRISNLTDLHTDTHSIKKINDYLDQTEKWVLPMAEQVNPDMFRELSDLIVSRRKYAKIMSDCEPE